MTVRPRPLRLAHRGDWRRGPENTLTAFLAALAVPACDGLEFDVRVSADDVPIVLHDETLARVQGLPARADALTARELGEAGVPTLAAILGAAPPGAFLDVELKGDHGQAVVDVLVAGRGRSPVNAVVSSFETDTLERIGGRMPDWPRWLNAEDLSLTTVATAQDLGCRGIAAEWHAIEPGSADRVRAAGLDLAAWTVRRRPTFQRLAGLGVVAVCVEAAALDG